MNFSNNAELIQGINSELGTFCSEFQTTRKELLRLGRKASSSAVFSFPDENRDWAINQGGGSEIQYHVYRNTDELGYGIGFNAQYVPFRNEKSSVDYIKPFIDAFLSEPKLELGLLNHGFEYIHGNNKSLRNIKHDDYILIGKKIKLSTNSDTYVINKNSLNELISDMKGIMFDTYKRVLELKGIHEKSNTMVSDVLKLLKYKKQVILQGPPGTGKTYTAKELSELLIFNNIRKEKAKQKKQLEESEEFALIQFHPSYSYEDFVRGIVAHTNDIGQIEYITENKILGEFSKKAHKNRLDHLRDNSENARLFWTEEKFEEFKDYVQISIDQGGEFSINETAFIYAVEDNAFRYKGRNIETQREWNASYRMKFTDIISGYLRDFQERQDFVKAKDLSGLSRQHATYFIVVLDLFREFLKSKNYKLEEVQELPIKLKNYVLVIDEINRANLPSVLGELIYALEYRNEKVNSMYAIDGDNSILLPDNLYIIGTMNTADRSVGHIDYAIKRRFAFVDLLPNPDVIKNAKARTLFEEVAKLFIAEGKNSEHVASDFDFKDIQLGHSYFMVNDQLSEDDQLAELEMKLKYEIKPILIEYVKDGVLLETAKKEIENLAIQ